MTDAVSAAPCDRDDAWNEISVGQAKACGAGPWAGSPIQVTDESVGTAVVFGDALLLDFHDVANLGLHQFL
jgi:hypothetical protein